MRAPKPCSTNSERCCVALGRNTVPSDIFFLRQVLFRSHEIISLRRQTLAAQTISKMGRLRFELRTNRLKAECSTAELTTRPGARRQGVARWATL